MSASSMSNIILNLSLSLEWEGEEDLNEICSLLKADLEYLLEERKLYVISCQPDTSQAIAFAQAQKSSSVALSSTEEQVQTSTGPLSSGDVAAVLGQYSLTLPKVKKGGPEWRTPSNSIYSYPRGLPTLYGKLVLTDGIHAIVVHDTEKNILGGRHKWSQIMLKNFMPDDWSQLDSFVIPQQKPDSKLESILEDF